MNIKSISISIFALIVLFLSGCDEIKIQPTLTDVTQINEDGFGSKHNKYAWGMAVFNDELYVGTLNTEGFELLNYFDDISIGTVDGCEVYRYNDSGTSWTRVAEEGVGNINNIGIRNMKVLKNCIYAVTMNISDGMEVLRSCDGDTWERVATGGFGSRANHSGRGLIEYNGYIYVGSMNYLTGVEIWRSKDGDHWENAMKGGFGSKRNSWISRFVEFDGYLYVGTMNLRGMELYRTKDGVNYELVFDRGLGRASDWMAMTIYVFKNQIFIGTTNVLRGFSIYKSADGIEFERVLESGYTNRSNAYIWSMQEYNGRLYAGTCFDQLAWFGQFQLLSTEDGYNWNVETADGYGMNNNYGIRNMTVYNNRLIMGTASRLGSCKVLSAESMDRTH